MTPAMPAGGSKKLWSVGDIVDVIERVEAMEDGHLLLGCTARIPFFRRTEAEYLREKAAQFRKLADEYKTPMSEQPSENRCGTRRKG